MKLIRIHIPQKRPKYRRGNFKLHHDNARPHVANNVLQFLPTKNIEIVPHPPYRPDLAPFNFFLFPTMKKDLKGRRFTSEWDNWGCTGNIKAPFKQWLRNCLPTEENSIKKMHSTWWGVLRWPNCKSIIFYNNFLMNFVSLFIEQPSYLGTE